MSITLDDVDLAIKILRIFLDRQRQAEILLRKLNVYERRAGRMGLSMDDFVNMAFQTIQRRKEEQIPIEELTDEDKKRLEEIASKLGITKK
ncbi:hypothetical protein KEJ48_05185 [Candidatus Bathyarchaeota archaeon]|nr:hypothetical protein [Candidatus Bathyarchaeota archaeon]